jgi:hypothetical protein
LCRRAVLDDAAGAGSCVHPAYESALVLCDLITAVLLFGQFNVFRSRALLVLASGYLFTAFIAFSHALTFPDVFSPTGLPGAGPQSTAWLYMFWHGGFPLFVILFALLKAEELRSAGIHGPVFARRQMELSHVAYQVRHDALWLFETFASGYDHVGNMPDSGNESPATCHRAGAFAILRTQTSGCRRGLWLLVGEFCRIKAGGLRNQSPARVWNAR